VTGLRRFLAPAAGPRAHVPGGAEPAGGRPEPGGGRCELCDAALPDEHRHIADLTGRRMLCGCTACHLLFTGPAAAKGRYRAVPRRHLRLPDARLPAAAWQALSVPVGILFVFRHAETSQGGERWAARYPGTAGAAEPQGEPGAFDAAWRRVLAAHPDLPLPEPDTEALLLRHTGAAGSCHLVPLDVCYRLVGVIRRHWRGFDGGSEAHARVEEFFTDLDARATTLTHTSAGRRP
jgi:hypothetical protein